MSQPETTTPETIPATDPISKTEPTGPTPEEKELIRQKLKSDILKALQKGKRPRFVRRRMNISLATYNYIMK